MNNKERELRIKAEMSKCKHFTGIQHDKCAVDVVYKDVRDSSKSPYEFPCLGADVECLNREYPTREEAEKEVDEMEQAVADFLTRLAKNECPVCEKPVTHKQQVGNCVYSDCGHRLYQGTI